LFSLRSMRFAQDAQVMPVIGSSMRAVVGAVVVLMVQATS
jgi:hypothetical protein